MPDKTLGVGFIGSGFITRFHIQSWVASATPTCAACGARTGQRRRGRGAGALAARRRRRGPSTRSRRWWPTRRSTASGSAAPTTRASRTWRRSSRAIAQGAKLIGDRLREAARRATSPRRKRMVELVEEAGCCTAISKTSCSRRALERGKRSSGRAARRCRPALPGARRRGAQRPAHALVLAG